MSALTEYLRLSAWLETTNNAPDEVIEAVIDRCIALKGHIIAAPPADIAAILAKVVILAEAFAEDCADNSDVALAFSSSIAGLEAMIPPKPIGLVKAA